MAARVVKRYTAAMVIVCILWAFVGYTFTNRYMDSSAIISLTGSLVAVIIIVQIERQIILGDLNNKGLRFSRYALAGLMALIGSTIIDQILFREDIELQRVKQLSSEVNELLPERSRELRALILNLDSTLLAKETERTALIEQISRQPNIKQYNKSTTVRMAGDTISDKVTQTNVTEVPNPKIDILTQLNTQIQDISKYRTENDSLLLALRPTIEAELKAHKGFLDELNLLISLLKESHSAKVVYLMWFLFLMLLEVLVVLSKRADSRSDYDDVIEQHMQLHRKQLSLHSKSIERV